MSELNRATAIPGLNREDAYRTQVNLAPLNEQKRIADKLDVLLIRVDACQERQDRIPLILKNFRQALTTVQESDSLSKTVSLLLVHLHPLVNYRDGKSSLAWMS